MFFMLMQTWLHDKLYDKYEHILAMQINIINQQENYLIF